MLLISLGDASGQAASGASAAGHLRAAMNAVEDGVLVSAETLIGKPLFLKEFYAASDLRYDAAGRVQGSPKLEEWTFSGVNVLKAQARPGEVELDGVRVAIRYNAEHHQFERHPLKTKR